MAFCCYDMNQASMPFWSLVLNMTRLDDKEGFSFFIMEILRLSLFEIEQPYTKDVM